MQGRCYCGEIRYEVTEAPVRKLQCHCRECQYISGGGPNFAMMVPDAGFAITRGTPQSFTRSDIDAPRTRQFCGTCGTHLTTILPGRGLTVVKAGTLDDPAGDYGAPEMVIFDKDRQPFHTSAEGLPCFDGLPG